VSIFKKDWFKSVDIEQWRELHPTAKPLWSETDGTFILFLSDKATGEVCIYRVFREQEPEQED
jgi:hypothetical protein